MVSIKPLTVNFSEDRISFSFSNIINSVQIQIFASSDGTKIEKIIANHLAIGNKKIELEISTTINFNVSLKTQLLSVLNYIGKSNLKLRLEGDITIDEIQATLNAFVVSHAVILVFDKLILGQEFNEYINNPFGIQLDANYEKILYKLRYFRHNKDNFIFRYIVPIIESFIGIYQIDKFDKKIFLKEILLNLTQFHQWKDSNTYEKIIKIRKDFTQTCQLYDDVINKYENMINRDIDCFRGYLNKIQDLNIKSEYFEEIGTEIKSLTIETGYSEAPINYPRFHQLELYDYLVKILELCVIENITQLKKVFEPELNRVKMRIKSSQDEKELIEFQNNLDKAQKDLKFAIQKAELKLEEDKNLLRTLVKGTISNFVDIHKINLRHHPHFDKLNFSGSINSLVNKLFYYQSNVNIHNYVEFIRNIENIFNTTKNIIGIINKIYPYITYDDIVIIINKNFSLLKNKIAGNDRIVDGHNTHINNFLEKMIKLESQISITEVIKFDDFSVIDWNIVIVGEAQKENLISEVSKILEYVDKLGLTFLKAPEIPEIVVKIPEIVVDVEEKIEEVDIIKEVIIYSNKQLTDLVLKLSRTVDELNKRIEIWENKIK